MRKFDDAFKNDDSAGAAAATGASVTSMPSAPSSGSDFSNSLSMIPEDIK